MTGEHLVIRFQTYAAAFVLAGIFSASPHAQDFPSKTIRIVTAAAGGGSDFGARQLALGLAPVLGQPVVVENRGSGVVQYDFLANSAPDGHSLVVSGGAFWIFPLIQKIPYDVVRDFVPISLMSKKIIIVAIHPSVPAKSIKELIALAKARPGQLNYASTVYGGPAHLAAEMFKSMAGVDIVNVPYKGNAPGIVALLSGEVQLTIIDAGELMPHVKSGRLRALAVTTAEPSPVTPGVPTVAASGLPGYEIVGETVLYAPGKTPATIISRLNQESMRYLTRPETKERFVAAGAEVVANSADQFAAYVKADIAKWTRLIKEAGIRAN